MPSALIIGYGNPLGGDDAAGYLAAESLGGLAVHQLTPELAEPIARAARVIFVDAAVAGQASACQPGAIRERAIIPDPQPAAFTHHLTPEALLAMAQFLYGHAPEAVLVTITAASFEPGAPLSARAGAALPAVLHRLLELRDQPAGHLPLPPAP
jgi:hydrogenase maturation protease